MERSIYVLVDDEPSIRYVGCSKDPVQRLAQHWRNRFIKKSSLYGWLSALNEPPRMEIVQVVTDDQAADTERIWISTLTDLPEANLLNQRVSSSGTHERSETTRQRISQSLLGIAKGRKASVETREKMRQAHLGKTFSEQHRENLSKVNRGRTHTEEARRNMSEAHRGKPWSAARRAAHEQKKQERQVNEGK